MCAGGLASVLQLNVTESLAVTVSSGALLCRVVFLGLSGCKKQKEESWCGTEFSRPTAGQKDTQNDL